MPLSIPIGSLDARMLGQKLFESMFKLIICIVFPILAVRMYGLYSHKNQYAALSGFVHMVLVVPYCLTHSHRSFWDRFEREDRKKIMPDSLNFISWRLKKLMCPRILDFF